MVYAFGSRERAGPVRVTRDTLNLFYIKDFPCLYASTENFVVAAIVILVQSKLKLIQAKPRCPTKDE